MSAQGSLDIRAPLKKPAALHGLWAFIRRHVLRIPPTPTPTLSAKPEEEQSAPVEPRGLRQRTQEAHASHTGALLSGIQEGLSAVPPLPHVVRELLRELSDPVSNARSVARFAASDPALAASLLRMVNSAALGLRRKITSVADAVSYLGYGAVRSLVLRMRLEQILPTSSETTAYDAEDLWIHSLAVSRAADCLAERIGGVDRGFVSTLGLLHDIGKLAINSQFPASALALRDFKQRQADESLLQRERRILGADHAEIGAILGAHWKLPPDLVTAIRYHHAPLEMPAELPASVRHAAGVVHIANQLAKYCYAYSEEMEIDIVGDDLFEELNIPGPLTRLLGSRMRSAISRAIFFADENSTRPLSAIRRFLRLYTPEQAKPLLDHPRWRSHLEPHIRVYDSLPEGIFDEGCPVVDQTGRRTFCTAEMEWTSSPRVMFLGRANAGGVASIIASAIKHLDCLRLEDEVRQAGRFVVRRLLPAISEISGGVGGIEVAQSLQNGRFILAVRSDVLAFEQRFGVGVLPRAALGVVEEELANVLNLRWFSEIRITPYGTTLIFMSHPRGG